MIGAVPDNRRCIVIGAGLLGLSSAWALTRRGWDVLVLEAAAGPGHARAGSKGDARIFRLGYPEPHYVEMALLSRARWRDLEAVTARRLLHVTGQVTMGDEEAQHAIAAALTAAGAPVEEVSATAAAQRFPGIDLSGPVLVEPDSGVLAADVCLQALRDAAGCEVRAGTRVTSVRQGSGVVSVAMADGSSLSAAVAVVCAGPGTLGLLGIDSPAAEGPSLPQVAYFASRDGGLPPVFIEWGDDMVYGLPVFGGGAHSGTYKLARHAPGPALPAFDPADPAPLGDDDEAELAQLTGAVARLLPGLHPQPVATERCVYDNSADADFLLDRVGNVVLGCGTSGHGFKFGPLLGELLADLAEDRAPAVDLARFGLHRQRPAPVGPPPVPR
jgi:sarcosine oxidase